MPISDICQGGLFSHKGHSGGWERLAFTLGVGGLGLAGGGCLPLHDPYRLSPDWSPALGAGPGPGPGAALAGLALLALGLLASLVLLAWLARRLFWPGAEEAGASGVMVDREDLALWRTARQALGFLLAKRLRQLKVTRLGDWLAGRGDGG